MEHVDPRNALFHHQKICSPLGDRIKHFPKSVGPCAEATLAPNLFYDLLKSGCAIREHPVPGAMMYILFTKIIAHLFSSENWARLQVRASHPHSPTSLIQAKHDCCAKVVATAAAAAGAAVWWEAPASLSETLTYSFIVSFTYCARERQKERERKNKYKT